MLAGETEGMDLESNEQSGDWDSDPPGYWVLAPTVAERVETRATDPIPNQRKRKRQE